jgi:hypothetical protein
MEVGVLKPNLNGDIDHSNMFQIWTNSKGNLHREDGPAVVWDINDQTDMTLDYYIDGTRYSKDEWIQYLKSGQSSLDQKTLNRLILENI